MTALRLLILSALLYGCGPGERIRILQSRVDSLAGAIGTAERGLSVIDTAALEKVITRYSQYVSFISEQLNDTLEKEEADDIQRFLSSGSALITFRSDRAVILSACRLHTSQLRKLATDLSLGAVNDRILSDYEYERQTTGEITAQAESSDATYHEALTGFHASLPGVEKLIRTRNNNELPTIITQPEMP